MYRIYLGKNKRRAEVSLKIKFSLISSAITEYDSLIMTVKCFAMKF